MPNLNHILSRALNDKFQAVSNPVKLAQDFCQDLWLLGRAVNRAFEKGEHSVGGSWHYILDIDEAAKGSILRPDPKTIVVFMNIHDSCKSDLRRQFAPLPEPGLILSFSPRGAVTAVTTKNPLINDAVPKIKTSRTETCRVTDHNRLESFIATWLRANFDAKTMVAIQEELSIQDQKESESFWLWSIEQRDRMQSLTR